MAGRPTHSRGNSTSGSGDHRPAQPSTLRLSQHANDDGSTSNRRSNGDGAEQPQLSHARRPAMGPRASTFSTESTPLMQSSQGNSEPGGAGRTNYHHAHAGPCNHGTFSPRPESPAGGLAARHSDDDGTESTGSGTTFPVLDDAISHIVGHDDWKRWLKKRMRTRKMDHSSNLAEQAGIRDTPMMYVA
jgi:hypothetical protein